MNEKKLDKLIEKWQNSIPTVKVGRMFGGRNVCLEMRISDIQDMVIDLKSLKEKTVRKPIEGNCKEPDCPLCGK